MDVLDKNVEGRQLAKIEFIIGWRDELRTSGVETKLRRTLKT